MNLQNLQEFAEQFNTIACIISIESTEDGGYENIRLETGNQAYLHSFPPQVHFVPGQIYTNYIPKDLNFEHFIYNAAVLKKNSHSYIYSDFFGAWFNIFSLPVKSDEPNKYYCVYTQEIDEKNDPELMAKHSTKISFEVLKICIKLRNSKSFQDSIDEVISDIREMCKAGQCCLLLTNFKTGTTYLQSESMQENTTLKSFRSKLDHPFTTEAKAWVDGIAGSNCLIIRDEKDMNAIKERNANWYATLVEAGIQSIALFPLKNNDEIIGFIWTSNFDTKNTDYIKEALELTTFFIASEVANHLLLNRLEELSENDLLTGVKNRNAMNNWVTDFNEGKIPMPKSIGTIFIDLNGLKVINDIEGHAAGDNFLKAAANMLKNIFKDCEIYRAGGDEFLIIAQNVSKEHLEECIQNLHSNRYNSSQIHFAVGFYYQEGQCNIIQAMKKADALMYEDKRRYYAEHPNLKMR